MAKPRVFTHPDTQSGVYHVVSRIVDRQFRFGEPEKEAFARMMKAFAAFHQVEILTFCLMGNHFHLLIRVPQRPEGFDVPFDELMALWQRAVGEAWNKGMQRQFEIWHEAGGDEAIEQWRQRMLSRMFSLSEFMKALKQRFTQWYNRHNNRTGTLWEGRYKSVIVQDEESALRTMATYIDLNPVRAGLTDDPGTWRWSGYAEAMTGDAQAMENIAQITGATAERVQGRGLGEPVLEETPAQRRRRHLKALVLYRQMLGLAGRPRTNEAGQVIRRGVSAKVQSRLEQDHGLRREQVMKRVEHFTRGVIIGSRTFIDEWFSRNRPWFGGKSAAERKSGARSIGKGWTKIYNLRHLVLSRVQDEANNPAPT